MADEAPKVDDTEARKPYTAPAIVEEIVFEREALLASCKTGSSADCDFELGPS